MIHDSYHVKQMTMSDEPGLVGRLSGYLMLAQTKGAQGAALLIDVGAGVMLLVHIDQVEVQRDKPKTMPKEPNTP